MEHKKHLNPAVIDLVHYISITFLVTFKTGLNSKNDILKCISVLLNVSMYLHSICPTYLLRRKNNAALAEHTKQQDANIVSADHFISSWTCSAVFMNKFFVFA